MRNMAVLHSPAFSYPLPVLVRVLFNLLIFKGKILYYNKYKKIQVLAEKGNGNHAYIDNLQEANRVLVGEFGATLHTGGKRCQTASGI